MEAMEELARRYETALELQRLTAAVQAREGGQLLELSVEQLTVREQKLRLALRVIQGADAVRETVADAHAPAQSRAFAQLMAELHAGAAQLPNHQLTKLVEQLRSMTVKEHG